MEDSLHREVEIDASSRSQSLQTSLCDVCQGLFDKESPRGFVLERAPHDPESDLTRHIYTFIHHPDLEALLASAEAGCRLCAIIGTRMEPDSPVSATGCSPAQRSGSPIAGAKAAQPNDDILAAIKLAEYGKREREYILCRLGHSARGRIIIQWHLEDGSPVWFHGNEPAEIHCWSGPSSTDTFKGRLYHFCTPCMFDYPQKTNCIIRFLTS